MLVTSQSAVQRAAHRGCSLGRCLAPHMYMHNMHPHTRTCTHQCTWMHMARAHAYMPIPMHTDAHGTRTYMHVHMCTCPYQCTRMHMHMVHTHACTCIYTHMRCTHVHECSYTCTCMHTRATFGELMNEGGVLVGAEERDRCVRSFLAQLLNFLHVLG